MYYKVDITETVKPKYLCCAIFKTGQYFNILYKSVKLEKWITYHSHSILTKQLSNQRANCNSVNILYFYEKCAAATLKIPSTELKQQLLSDEPMSTYS